MITTVNLEKRYGHLVAIKNLNLHIEQAEMSAELLTLPVCTRHWAFRLHPHDAVNNLDTTFLALFRAIETPHSVQLEKREQIRI